jgi:hypothetical protein
MKNFKLLILALVCAISTTSFSQPCLSSGNDTTVTVYQSEPFVLNDFLSSNAYDYGTWESGVLQYNNFDTIQLNFPGMYSFYYIVNDTLCNTSDTSNIVINVQQDYGWGLDEINNNKISIYPNPTTNGVFTLSKELDYYIEDETGKKIDAIRSSGLYFIVVNEKYYKLINY